MSRTYFLNTEHAACCVETPFHGIPTFVCVQHAALHTPGIAFGSASAAPDPARSDRVEIIARPVAAACVAIGNVGFN